MARSGKWSGLDLAIPFVNGPLMESHLIPANHAAKETMKALLTANPHNLTRSGSRGRPPDQPARSRLAQIAVPTLIVVGESDIPDVHTHIGVIQSGIQGADRMVLAHSGHLCQMEVPEAFNKAVLGLLAALPVQHN